MIDPIFDKEYFKKRGLCSCIGCMTNYNMNRERDERNKAVAAAKKVAELRLHEACGE